MSLADIRAAIVHLGNQVPPGSPSQGQIRTIENAITDLSDRLDAMEQIIITLGRKARVSAADVVALQLSPRGLASPNGYQIWIHRILP
jgi:hypothetical protein